MTPLDFAFLPLPAAAASRADLSPAAKLLLALVARSGGKGGPLSVRTAARALGLDTSTVGRALRCLLACGLVERTAGGRLAGGGRRGEAAHYRAIAKSLGACKKHARAESTRRENADASACKKHTQRVQKARACACKKHAPITTERETREGERAPPSPGAPPPHDNGDGNGQADDETLLKIAFPGGPSERQRAVLVTAAAEARRAGADEPALRLALRRATTKPWLALARLAERLARQPAEAPAPTVRPDVPPPEPAAPWLPAVVMRIRGLGIPGIRLLSADASEIAQVLAEVPGEDLSLGLPVRASRPDGRNPGIRRRLRTAEDLAAFDLGPERIGAEVLAG